MKKDLKRPSIRKLLEKKELDPTKKTELEKGDKLALIIAAFTMFFPVLIGVFAFFALIIFLFL